MFVFSRLKGLRDEFSVWQLQCGKCRPKCRRIKRSSSARQVPCPRHQGRLKDTKNKDGQYLEIVFEILKGEHEGKRLYGRLNLRNKSADACRIAEGELSALCHAINVKRPRNEQALLNIPLVVAVELEARKDKQGPNGETLYSNRIRGYESVEQAYEASKARHTVPDDDDVPF